MKEFIVSIVYFRDRLPESIAPAISSRVAHVAPEPPGRGHGPAGYSWRERLREWRRRRRSRTSLAHLGPAMLKDIGVTYAEAEREANKPFWLP
jgi:uncharacterized protein YjiS (DUF1127 family)